MGRCWRAVLLCIGIGVGVLAGGAAWAEGRVALVVGNKDYSDGPLHNTLNDARDMAAELSKLGFDVIKVENTSRRQLLEAIRRFQSRIRPGDTALAYYSGHGMQIGGTNYLIPINSEFDNEREAQYENVRAEDVLTAMADAKARTSILILDACRTNPFQRSFRSVSRGLAQMNASAGTLIAYATAPGTEASDGDGSHGLYTTELLKAIRKPGVPVEQTLKQVRIAVSAASEGAQIPWEASSLTGDFCFAGCTTGSVTAMPTPTQPGSPSPPPTPSHATAPSQNTARPADPQAADAAFWARINKTSDPRNFQEYLDAYPQGRFSQQAKLLVQTLGTTSSVDPQAADAAFWARINKTSDPRNFQEYLSAYPQGRFARQAKLLVQTLGTTSSTDSKGDSEKPTADRMAAGAIAVDDEDGLPAKDVGWGVGYGVNKDAAARDAMHECSDVNTDCKVVLHFTTCGAYATSSSEFGVGVGATKKAAAAAALSECGAKACQVVVSRCVE